MFVFGIRKESSALRVMKYETRQRLLDNLIPPSLSRPSAVPADASTKSKAPSTQHV